MTSLWKHGCVYRLTWTRFDNLIASIAARTVERRFEVIVGMSRGGLIPAVCLSDLLSVPQLLSVRVIRNRHDKPFSDRSEPVILDCDLSELIGKHVLIVDDIVGTGSSMQVVAEQVARHGPSSVTTLAIVANASRQYHPNHYAVEADDWVVFPWEPSYMDGGSGSSLSVIDL